MRVAGVAVNIPTRGRPVVRIVVLEESSGTTAVRAVEEIPTADVDIAEQVFQVGRSVESRVRGLEIDRVIVRRADVPTRASKKDAPRLRLLIEGAAVSAARSVVIDTRLGMGKDVARWGSRSKEALDRDAKTLITSAGYTAKFTEAAGAALAGLAL